MVRARTFLRLMARLAVMVSFAAPLLYSPSPGWAQTVPDLGSAGTFAVLAGSAVTCTDSTVTGDVGVSPGTAVTNTRCTINGTIHANNAVAVQANNDFFSAYNALEQTLCTTVETRAAFTDEQLTRETGVHCFGAAATFTRVTLTLTGSGPWIFKIGTGGTGALTGSGLSVVTPAGADACKVDWWVAQAATMTDSTFVGNILAGTAIDITRGTVTGNAYAKTAVTMTSTTIGGCARGRDVTDLLVDHFQCYEATPQERVRPHTVVLEDQFGKRTVTLRRPQSICTPVVRNAHPNMPPVGKFPDDLRNPSDHLVCYQIEDRHGHGVRKGRHDGDDDDDGYGRRKGRHDDDNDDGHGRRKGSDIEVLVENQFGEQHLKVKKARLLCVPSLKTLLP